MIIQITAILEIIMVHKIHKYIWVIKYDYVVIKYNWS